jgi:Tfp pilus assembly protein PilF
MPATTYMQVDPRRDHGFRVPRPDLTVDLGTPNACNGCHGDRSPEWSVEAVERWYGPGETAPPHFAVALDAGRKRLPHALRMLEQVAVDPEQAGIVRASALSLLRTHVGPPAVHTIERALGHRDPIVRVAGLGAIESVDPREHPRLAFPLLDDPVRAVRIEAARVLASLPDGALPPEQRSKLDRGLAEYRAAQMVNAERPESLMNLAWLHVQLGEHEQAESVYRSALSIQPGFGSTYVNLADLYRMQGRDDQGEQVLRQGIERIPGDGNLHHALGLLLVRTKRLPEALVAMRESVKLRPDEPRYAYVLGVGLYDSGAVGEGLEVLERAHGRHPADRSILLALTSFKRDQGTIDEAVVYARQLLLLVPGDPAVRRLLDSLEAELR